MKDFLLKYRKIYYFKRFLPIRQLIKLYNEIFTVLFNSLPVTSS